MASTVVETVSNVETPGAKIKKKGPAIRAAKAISSTLNIDARNCVKSLMPFGTRKNLCEEEIGSDPR